MQDMLRIWKVRERFLPIAQQQSVLSLKMLAPACGSRDISLCGTPRQHCLENTGHRYPHELNGGSNQGDLSQ